VDRRPPNYVQAALKTEPRSVEPVAPLNVTAQLLRPHRTTDFGTSRTFKTLSTGW